MVPLQLKLSKSKALPGQKTTRRRAYVQLAKPRLQPTPDFGVGLIDPIRKAVGRNPIHQHYTSLAT